ncbi:hypothetical protein BJ912DRAFT_1045203 [Pholiota molesta]|nr:hypothetical protein BJ912DRAFT_1045203 [Pholiota molesta]
MAIIHQPQTRRPALPAALPSSSRASTTAPPAAAPDIPPNILARAFTQQIIHIFTSARYPYPSVRSMWQVTLPLYISGILYAARLPVEVGLSAMVLVFRYKDAVPHSVAYGDDAARLFLAAYIIAAKVVADGGGGGGGAASPPQTLDFWFRVSQQRFPVEELRRMELQLCRILRWDVQVSREALACIRRSVYQECGEVGDEALEVMEEEEEETGEEEEQRVRYGQYVERPPPSYCESERDVRVVETPGAHGTAASQGEYSGSRRGSWQGGISPMVRPQAQALIPSANGMTHEDYEDRQSFGRIFEEHGEGREQERQFRGEGEEFDGGGQGKNISDRLEEALFTEHLNVHGSSPSYICRLGQIKWGLGLTYKLASNAGVREIGWHEHGPLPRHALRLLICRRYGNPSAVTSPRAPPPLPRICPAYVVLCRRDRQLQADVGGRYKISQTRLAK